MLADHGRAASARASAAARAAASTRRPPCLPARCASTAGCAAASGGRAVFTAGPASYGRHRERHEGKKTSADRLAHALPAEDTEAR